MFAIGNNYIQCGKLIYIYYNTSFFRFKKNIKLICHKRKLRVRVTDQKTYKTHKTIL